MSSAASSMTLPPDPRNVGRARTFVRTVLLEADAEEQVEVCTLVVSELVTNAFVHAGTEVSLRVQAGPGAVRVEIEDDGSHLPARRRYAETAGTGRGLQLVEELTDRWGVDQRAGGKTVWFELGRSFTEPGSSPAPGQGGGEISDQDPGSVPVTLLQVPLLMHLAWQEHAATLLREFLLYALEEDPAILVNHAQASEAPALLAEQIPAPELADDPEALMAAAIEPIVTQTELILRIPHDSVPSFAVLDDLLAQAIAHATAGRFLSPPTQPEIDEMRQWFCQEVARQAKGGTTATPWVARTDVRATLADQAELATRYRELAADDGALLATDEASIIVAASPAALALLGYDRADQLVGRRVIVVVPARFHQAHIAGTTMHVTNGRSTLLGVPITVPMVHADGTEVMVSIEVCPQRIDDDHRVFVARFHAA